MQSCALHADHLVLRYDGHAVLDGFCLNVDAGGKITLAGPSGSGKSTLLRCLMGFLRPESGSIYVGGEEMTDRSVWSLRRRMAYVAQEPELGEGTVLDVLARPFQYRVNRHLRFDMREASALLERFLLPADLVGKGMAGLSGGEKQRVALAGAVLLKRPILLLDEVASALDPESKQAARAFLRSLEGVTVLSVSHDARDFSLSERIVRLGSTARERNQ